MSRLIDIDALNDTMYYEAFENNDSYDERNPMARWDSGLWIRYKMFENVIADALTIDIVSCKECKHRPIKEDIDGEDYGFNIIKPNRSERCPCLVEDGWYSWMPKDDFYCGFGEREDE